MRAGAPVHVCLSDVKLYELVALVGDVSPGWAASTRNNSAWQGSVAFAILVVCRNLESDGYGYPFSRLGSVCQWSTTTGTMALVFALWVKNE